MLLALLIEIVTSLRRGDVGLDVVAALSMGGALAFGEYLAAVVVALMYAGGQYLESFAERRATRAEKSGTQFADAQWPSLSIDRRSTLWTR